MAASWRTQGESVARGTNFRRNGGGKLCVATESGAFFRSALPMPQYLGNRRKDDESQRSVVS